MMNLTRREPFTIDISLDCDADTLQDFMLYICQSGRSVCGKGLQDAVIGEGGRSASVTLTGEETAMFRSFEPAYAQACAVLANGEHLHSEAEEINVVDVLGA